MNIPTKYIEQYSQNAHAIEEKILQGVNLSGDAGFEEMFCKFINEFPEGNTIMYLWNCVFVFAQDPDFAIKVHNKISLSLVSAFNQLDPNLNWDMKYLQHFFPSLYQKMENKNNIGEEHYKQTCA